MQILEPADLENEATAVKALIQNNFEKQSPAIIKVVVRYASLVKVEYLRIVSKVNELLLQIVVWTMSIKGEFHFTELKCQFKNSQSLIKVL